MLRVWLLLVCVGFAGKLYVLLFN